MAKVVEAQLQKARNILIEKLPIEEYLYRKGYIDADEKNEVKYKIRCPVHEDSSPSFFYDTEGKTCHCFGCHAKGSVVELHWNIEQKLNEKYSIVKAIQNLAKEFKIAIPDMFKYEVVSKEELEQAGTYRKRKRTKRENPLKQKRKEIELKRLDRHQGIYSVADMWKQSRIIDRYLLGEETFEEAYRQVKAIHKSYLDQVIQDMIEKEEIEVTPIRSEEIEWE